jgi:phosphoribosylformylglycinamidine (FGAM) synthase-like enzyme
MSPLEIWCNEAQERYVLAVEPRIWLRFEAICERERCPYAVVGEATRRRTCAVRQPFRQRAGRPAAVGAVRQAAAHAPRVHARCARDRAARSWTCASIA